jgi:hypothetical protein
MLVNDLQTVDVLSTFQPTPLMTAIPTAEGRKSWLVQTTMSGALFLALWTTLLVKRMQITPGDTSGEGFAKRREKSAKQ